MSVTFYAKSPVLSTAERAAYIEAVDGPNWANGNAAYFLELIGLGERDLWGGRAAIAEARAGLAALDVQAALRRWPSIESVRARIAIFTSFLNAAERAGATEIYWA